VPHSCLWSRVISDLIMPGSRQPCDLDRALEATTVSSSACGVLNRLALQNLQLAKGRILRKSLCCKMKFADLRGLISPRILAAHESYLPHVSVHGRNKFIMYSELYKQLKFFVFGFFLKRAPKCLSSPSLLPSFLFPGSILPLGKGARPLALAIH